MMIDKVVGQFHLLTDFHFQQKYSHAELARLGVDGGVDTIQFRQKSGGIRHVLAQAKETALFCGEAGIPFLINDRIDVALACEADGVHLGQSDFPIRDARQVLGDEAIIGATATTLDQALRARDEGADYVGFGPVYLTGSKSNPEPVKGLDALAYVCERLDVPVIAIAGIKSGHVAEIIKAGAHGIAVMTAVTTSDDPAQAAHEIRRALDACHAQADASSDGRSTNGRGNAVR